MIQLPFRKLKTYVPGETMVLVNDPLETRRGVYIWTEGEWILRRWWTIEQISKLIGHSPEEIENYRLPGLATRSHYGRTYNLNELAWQYDTKIGWKLQYPDVLKLKFILDLRASGKLTDYLQTNDISKLYDHHRTHHVI